MSVIFQSHGGSTKPKAADSGGVIRAAPPAGADIAVDAEADFGYFFPPQNTPDNYLKEDAATVDELDTLGNLMIEQGTSDAAAADSAMPPVLTYWGQFLDHELTARTDREGNITSIRSPHPPASADLVEETFKNARTPRFDLDSVYGGSPIGAGITADIATVISGMRHPTLTNKMRVGTAQAGTDLPDTLDPHRDLPRYVQVQASVRAAALRVAQTSMSADEFAAFEAGLPHRALIGDQRNDENLLVAQFHLSFLRFHNKVIDFLESHNTGWIADFASAQMLTRLHYQWLIVEGYLKGVCDPAVVTRVLDDRASHFFNFRAQYDTRRPKARLGDALPIEFSAAAYRFGHSMVRAAYDHNKIFGRPDNQADFDLLFAFTGGGGMFGSPTLPRNWIIDWKRFVGTDPLDSSDGKPARFARRIDTELAPPLGRLDKEANDEQDAAVQAMFKQLARRNLRRGYNLRLPTGQALHSFLKSNGAVQSNPITDVSTLFAAKPALRDFLKDSGAELHERTPLWFYCLAEAEQSGGERLGEVGSWLVASTFIGVLLADPDSALSRGFTPALSPLRMPDNSPIDSIVKWMKFAIVMQ
jgi:Animal haem peroxidase